MFFGLRRARWISNKSLIKYTFSHVQEQFNLMVIQCGLRTGINGSRLNALRLAPRASTFSLLISYSIS